jgi:hypothetical protein
MGLIPPRHDMVYTTISAITAHVVKRRRLEAVAVEEGQPMQ